MRYIAILGLVFAGCAAPEQALDQHRPNIVFIFADDLGYGDLSSFGSETIRTPHIDRLGLEGIRFTDFYSASPVCSPSRAGLLTGRMPQRMGINNVFFPESFTGMPPEEVTIAELLKQKDYATGIVGKWHLGHFEKFLPLQQGFDSYFGIPYSNDMRSVVYMRDNEVETFEVDQRLTTRTYTEEALSFIDAHQDEPFYLYVAHNQPHVPIYASEPFEGRSKAGLYADVIEEIDGSVGKILDKLEALDLLENTLVIFSSDNGPWLVMEDHGGSAGPLREGKQFTFDGGMRVPTLAMWKGRIEGGQVYSGVATQMDWFPTFATITGAAIPDDRPIDGVDLSPVLFEGAEREGNTFLFFNGAKLEGYRKGDYKIKMPYAGNPGSPWRSQVAPHDTLLVNMAVHPGEVNNLYPEEKELALALIEEMYAKYEGLGSLPPSLVVSGPQDNSHFEYLEQKRKNEIEIK